jgi:biotin transport system substrate-specific component
MSATANLSHRDYTFLKTAGIAIAGAAAMTLAAKTQIPFWPVPLTLHTMAVMAFAVFLGPRAAVSIFLAYLASGAAGLPVFSGTPERGIGIAYMVGPTGGYLLGYLVASWVVGALARGRSAPAKFGAMVVGLVVIYGFGLAWLWTLVPADRLLAVGLLPLLPGDLVKVALVALASMLVEPAIRRWMVDRS